MASRGQSTTIQYLAWDNLNARGKTGDVANHILRWIKDGTVSIPTNSPVECDATNAPGIYKLVLTSDECTCNLGTLAGRSTTSSITIVPQTMSFEQLPTPSPGSNGGLPTVDANNQIVGIQSAGRSALASAFLDELITGHVTADSVGAAFIEILDGLFTSADRTKLDNLDNQISTVIDLGQGAFIVDVTVTDGTNPVEGAKVRFHAGTESYVGTTSSTGEVQFHLDRATWTVGITKPGYNFEAQSVAITADCVQEFTLDQTTFTLSEPDKVTGYLYCYDENGLPEHYVDVDIAFFTISSTGFGYDVKTRTETSDALGLVEFTNLISGGTYMIRRGSQKVWQQINSTYSRLSSSSVQNWLKFTIPEGATGAYALPTIWGQDAEP